MSYDRAKLFILAACLASGAIACDQEEEGPESHFRTLGGIGSGGGYTLNTNQPVSSSDRDVYEFDLNGTEHTNGYGYKSSFFKLSLDASPYGAITTLVSPGSPPPPGKKAVIVPGDVFAVDVYGSNPGSPVHRLSGTALIGLELHFKVKGYDNVPHDVVLELIDHLADPMAGDFYAITKVDPVTGEHLAPLCEEDAGGYRLARIYDALSFNTQSGEITYPDAGIHHVACSSGSLAKAALFGYPPDPARTDTLRFTLANRVVRADYCADGTPYTYPGNLLDIEDNFSPGQEGKTIEDVVASLGADEVLEAVWDANGVLCMNAPRADNLSREDVLCPIKRLGNGSAVYNWQPPTCEGWTDPMLDGGGIRFFSKGSL
jgi:hypothetical protein